MTRCEACPLRYTLLELIVVISILALVMTLAAGRMGSGSSRLQLKSEADETASFLSSARATAIQQGRRVPVLLEGRSLSFESSDAKDAPKKVHAIPESVELKAKAKEVDGKARLFAFFPDGRGSGSPLELSLKSHSFEISVSPLTGAPSAKEAQE